MSRVKKVAAAVVAAICSLKRRKRNAKRRVWRKTWIQNRRTHGAFRTLLPELQFQDPMQYRNFLRMTAVQMEELVRRIGPVVCKKDTYMRSSISVNERLAVTLRFLASGDIELLIFVRYT